MELKKIKKKDSAEDTLDTAMHQIKETEYVTELKDKKVKKIMALAIAMKGKQVELRSENLCLKSK